MDRVGQLGATATGKICKVDLRSRRLQQLPSIYTNRFQTEISGRTQLTKEKGKINTAQRDVRDEDRE
jgi:hypothetical protein